MNLLKSSLYTFGTRVILFLTSIISSIVVVKMIGAEGKGIISYVQTFFGFVVLFGTFGIGNGLIYFASREDDNRGYFDTTFFYGLSFALIIVVITILFLTNVKATFFEKIPEIYIYVGLIYLVVEFLSISSDSYCRAKKKSKLYNISLLLGQGFFLTAVVILWLTGYEVEAFYVLLATIVQNLLKMIYRMKGLQVFPKLKSVGKNYFKKMAGFGIKGFFGVLAQKMNVRLDILLLGMILPSDRIGYYAIAATIAEMVWYIPDSIGVFLYPKIASENDSVNSANSIMKINRITIAIVSITAFILFFLSSSLLPLMYGSDFTESVIPNKILLIGTVGLSIQKILTKYFAGIGKPLVSSYTTIIGLFINIPLLYLLLPSYGITGAAIASSITYISIGILSIIFFFNYSETEYNLKDLLFIKRVDIIELFNNYKSRNKNL